MSTLSRLKGFTNFGNTTLSSQIELNFIELLRWGFLELGAFANVRIPSSGLYGADHHRLRAVRDKNYTNGQVWEGFRNNWVWESGIEYSVQPIQISGVYVNGGFQPATGVGTYAHSVDYPNGRVVFDSPIAVSSVVTCEYSYHYVNFVPADNEKYIQAQTRCLQTDSSAFLASSGDYNTLATNKVQLPIVAIDAVGRISYTGKQQGGGQIVSKDVTVDIITDKIEDRNKIYDIISEQRNKGFVLFDVNDMAAATGFPLDDNGDLAAGGVRSYVQMIAAEENGGFAWKNGHIAEIYAQQGLNYNPRLFRAGLRLVLEIDMPEI